MGALMGRGRSALGHGHRGRPLANRERSDARGMPDRPQMFGIFAHGLDRIDLLQRAQRTPQTGAQETRGAIPNPWGPGSARAGTRISETENGAIGTAVRRPPSHRHCIDRGAQTDQRAPDSLSQGTI
ncbi:MAG: hypothetical protein C7B46_17145 [Sulfobacillus benefaciens]|uniref:Uncharacterized protein n=1 Tax=Sulfobacillus benefaciens TaxID=453960 RepID=A0A2T2X9P7_9FIRM|nr:MAG: hypothetical protein C7B46_17145 [Sulfobacillus benefaciens]